MGCAFSIPPLRLVDLGLAVVESFFPHLKRERIKGQTYLPRGDARADVFDYIELFYSQKRRHRNNYQLSPA